MINCAYTIVKTGLRCKNKCNETDRYCKAHLKKINEVNEEITDDPTTSMIFENAVETDDVFMPVPPPQPITQFIPYPSIPAMASSPPPMPTILSSPPPSPISAFHQLSTHGSTIPDSNITASLSIVQSDINEMKGVSQIYEQKLSHMENEIRRLTNMIESMAIVVNTQKREPNKSMNAVIRKAMSIYYKECKQNQAILADILQRLLTSGLVKPDAKQKDIPWLMIKNASDHTFKMVLDDAQKQVYIERAVHEMSQRNEP
jgi:hypothetical protein